jgi:teichuronic acid exporter
MNSGVASDQDLTRTASLALRWGIFARFAVQLVTWGSTLFVIRLVEPSDYGLLALAMTVVAFAEQLNDVGLTASIVQAKKLDPDQFGALFTFSLLINFVIYICIYAGAPLAAAFFESDIVAVLRVVGLAVFFLAVGRLQETHLVRQLDFKKKAKVDTVAQILASMMTLLLAWHGWGVWALVAGILAGSLARAIGFSVASPISFRANWSFRVAVPHLSFGGFIFGQRLAYWLLGQIDIIALGWLQSSAGVGSYHVGKNLANLPNSKVGNVVGLVAFAAYSRVQDEMGRLWTGLQSACRYLAIVSFPVFAGLAIVAEDLVIVVLSEKWQAAALPMAILSSVVPLRMLGSQLSNALNGIGRPKDQLINSLTHVGMIIPCVCVGAGWGVVGVAAGWVLGYAVSWLLVVGRTVPIFGVHPSEFYRPLAKPLFATAVMSCAALLAQLQLADPEIPSWLRLAAVAGVGAAVYGVAIFTLARRELLDMAEFVLARRLGRKVAAPAS